MLLFHSSGTTVWYYVLFETSLISGIIGFSFPFHLSDFACISLLLLFFSHLHLRECLIYQIEVGHFVPNVYFCIFKLLFSISPCMSHYRVKFSMHISFFTTTHPLPHTEHIFLPNIPGSQCLKFSPKPSVFVCSYWKNVSPNIHLLPCELFPLPPDPLQLPHHHLIYFNLTITLIVSLLKSTSLMAPISYYIKSKHLYPAFRLLLMWFHPTCFLFHYCPTCSPSWSRVGFLLPWENSQAHLCFLILTNVFYLVQNVLFTTYTNYFHLEWYFLKVLYVLLCFLLFLTHFNRAFISTAPLSSPQFFSFSYRYSLLVLVTFLLLW